MIRALSLLLLFAGCSREVAFLSTDGLASMLLIEVQGPTVAVTAYDLAADTLIKTNAPEGAEVYVVGLASPLDALDLAPGDVAVGPTGSPLPAGVRYHQLDGASWVDLAELPAAVRATPIVYIDRCARFTVDERPWRRRGIELTTFAIPLDPERVMVASTDGVMTVVTATSITDRPDYDLPYYAAADRGGELWLVGPGTRVERGHPTRGFTAVSSLPFDLAGTVEIATSPPDAPLEVFVTDDSLRVAYYDGSSWRTIRDSTMPVVLGSDRRVGIGWAAPGLAFLIGDSNESVIELSTSGFQRSALLDLPLRGTADTLFSAAYLEGIGAIISSRYTVTFRRVDGHWDRLPLAKVTPTSSVIVDLGGSFMTGGQDGVFFEYRAGDKLCAPVTGLSYDRADVAARLGSGFITIGPRLEGEYVLVTATRTR